MLSMTNEERSRPDILNARRRQRIARGSGIDRHAGERFAPAFQSNAQADEEHGQNEKNDGADGANEKLTMAVSIRLRREGAKNRPYFKVVVADSRSPRDGKFIEIIGTYDPKKPGDNSTLKMDRAEYWIARGAQPSDTVRSLIKKNKKKTAAAPAAEAAAPAA